MSPVHRARCLVAVTVLLALAALPLLGQATGKKYALLVGINEYDHANLSILRYAENDVTALSNLLQKQGFEVVLLTTTAGKQEAGKAPTLTNIQKQLEALRKRCKRHDTLLVALAGHGLHFSESFFCPQDANPSEQHTATLLPLKRVYDQLGSCGAGAKLLLVDACRNIPRLNRGRNFDASTLTPPSGVAALFSCRKGEVAFEHESYRHGIFFQHVLEGLGGKAANPDREVTWDSLVEYVKRQVPPDVRRKIDQEARQTPTQSAVEFEGAVLVQAEVGKANTTAELKKELTIDLGNNVKLELVLIPAGEFLMGSPEGEADRRDDEKQHKVALTQPFWMGKYEVTQEQYQQIMRKNPSWFSASGGGADAVKNENTKRFPVEQVTWTEAKEFCDEVSNLPESKRSELLCSLPTEAQWEYACRGGARVYQVFHFGDSLSSRQANFNSDYPYGGAAKGRSVARPTTVGTYEKNGFGLYDMHGNVWEWCADWYDKDSHNNAPRKDPTGPATGTFRVLRGGSWVSDGLFCRSALRNNYDSGNRGYVVGFRVVVRSAP